MRWNQGRAEIDKLIADGELQLLADANPKRAYESLYDAARMALTAVLENEGLRPTSRGGHVAPYGCGSKAVRPHAPNAKQIRVSVVYDS